MRSGIAFALSAVVAALSLGPSDKSYTIKFEPVVGTKPFACGATYSGLGSSKSDITPGFLRLYISDVQLIDAAGKAVPLKLDQDGTWQQQDVVFLSFEGKNSACASGSPQDHRAIFGRAPEGRYVGVRFTIGVPRRIDHADATIASSPMNLSECLCGPVPALDTLPRLEAPRAASVKGCHAPRRTRVGCPQACRRSSVGRAAVS